MTADLNILAARYALGELAGEEAGAFEARLEDDQAAREALADAVLVMAAVRQLPAASSMPLTSLQRPMRLRMAAVISCAAACLVVAVMIRLPQVGRQDEPFVAAPIAEETTILGAWSELGSEHVLLSEFDSEPLRDDAASEIPDWMVAAVLENVDDVPREEGTL